MPPSQYVPACLPACMHVICDRQPQFMAQPTRCPESRQPRQHPLTFTLKHPHPHITHTPPIPLQCTTGALQAPVPEPPRRATTRHQQPITHKQLADITAHRLRDTCDHLNPSRTSTPHLPRHNTAHHITPPTRIPTSVAAATSSAAGT